MSCSICRRFDHSKIRKQTPPRRLCTIDMYYVDLESIQISIAFSQVSATITVFILCDQCLHSISTSPATIKKQHPVERPEYKARQGIFPPLVIFVPRACDLCGLPLRDRHDLLFSLLLTLAISAILLKNSNKFCHFWNTFSI